MSGERERLRATFGAAAAESEARIAGAFGVLRLTLRESGYEWAFVPTAGAGATDHGSGACHGAIANDTPPVVGGTPGEGETLSASTGAWTGLAPLAYAYQWQRCNLAGLGCLDLAGETSSTLVVPPTAVDLTVRVKVTASNAAGSASAFSTAVGPIVADPPANTAPPSISGTARVGELLTAAAGTWAGTGIAYTYEWRRCAGGPCAAIAGATSSTYRPVPEDAGSTLEVSVTATNSGGVASAVSAPTVAVAGLPAIWLSQAEVAALPMTGAAWDAVRAAADAPLPAPNIADNLSEHDVRTLAVALVYARLRDEPGGAAAYRTKAADAIVAAIGTEDLPRPDGAPARTLELARNTLSYIVAAELIDLRTYDAGMAFQFRTWVGGLRDKVMPGDSRTLVQTHERRPNNWGAHAGASRAAIDIYLGDTVDLARVAQVFEGYLGNRTAYAGFTFGGSNEDGDSDLTWQADALAPVAINAVGATKDGHPIDGAQPEEMRRGGPFQWPPLRTVYVWEALQGAAAQAQILDRQGYPAWSWQSQALRRAVQFLVDLDTAFPAGAGEEPWRASGDDLWVPWLVDDAYGTTFRSAPPAGYGKNMGWTDWTHAP